MPECSDADKARCRDECCRSFANVPFCDIESNCVTTPTWIVILVPILLGLAALVLLLIVLIRLKNRNVVDRYTFVQNQTSKMSKMTKPYFYHNLESNNLKLSELLSVMEILDLYHYCKNDFTYPLNIKFIFYFCFTWVFYIFGVLVLGGMGNAEKN
jgi:hypothetical protein